MAICQYIRLSPLLVWVYRRGVRSFAMRVLTARQADCRNPLPLTSEVAEGEQMAKGRAVTNRPPLRDKKAPERIRG